MTSQTSFWPTAQHDTLELWADKESTPENLAVGQAQDLPGHEKIYLGPAGWQGQDREGVRHQESGADCLCATPRQQQAGAGRSRAQPARCSVCGEVPGAQALPHTRWSCSRSRAQCSAVKMGQIISGESSAQTRALHLLCPCAEKSSAWNVSVAIINTRTFLFSQSCLSVRKMPQKACAVQGMESYCVRAFAEALEAIPYTLAENAGLNPIEIVTDLRNRHANGEKAAGINVRRNTVSDMLQENVVQPLLVTTSAIELATECVRMILKVYLLPILKLLLFLLEASHPQRPVIMTCIHALLQKNSI